MAETTTNHQTIQDWVSERGGHPARVKGTEKQGSVGLLRIDYPGYSGEDTLERLTWEEFFEAFDNNDLVFLYEAEKNSRFSKFVSRETADEKKGH
jgi:hypothetical protein